MYMTGQSNETSKDEMEQTKPERANSQGTDTKFATATICANHRFCVVFTTRSVATHIVTSAWVATRVVSDPPPIYGTKCQIECAYMYVRFSVVCIRTFTPIESTQNIGLTSYVLSHAFVSD